MSGGIFPAEYPDPPAGGDQLAGSPRRWLLVKREAGIPGRESCGGRGNLTAFVPRIAGQTGQTGQAWAQQTGGARSTSAEVGREHWADARTTN